MPYSIFHISDLSNSFMSYRKYDPVGYPDCLYYLHFIQYILYQYSLFVKPLQPFRFRSSRSPIVRVVPNRTGLYRFVYYCCSDRLDTTKIIL